MTSCTHTECELRFRYRQIVPRQDRRGPFAQKECPMWRKIILLTIALTALVLYVGCGANSSSPPQAASPTASAESAKTTQTKVEEHAHNPGAHGGNIVEIGRDNYHAEVVFEKGGTLKLFTLGKDEAKVLEVEAQTLTAQVQIEGDESETNPVLLKPAHKSGDAEGKRSQFVAP